MAHYPRAPITEAVFELRFKDPVQNELVEKVQARLREHYIACEPWFLRKLSFDVARASASVSDESSGYRLTDLDRLDHCIITTRNFTVSRLAPYTQWEDLYRRARRDWADWKRAVGYQRVERVGVRYINRIDVPCEPGANIELPDYIRCYPEVPKAPGLTPMASYAMQVSMPGGPDGFSLIINSASVPAPVINHVSFVLDIDVSREGNVPQSDEEIWGLIASIRDQKNVVFESCITDRARALFS